MSPQLKKRTCYFCAKSFNRKYYRDHVAIHTIEKCYPCPVPNCVARFTARSGLATHKRRHDPTCRFSCALCSKMTKTKHDLFSHISHVHLLERPYKCDQCEKRFTAGANLKSHLATHLGKHDRKLWPCDSCMYMATAKGCLKTHVNSVHLNLRPIPCLLCPKKFRNKFSRDIHLNRVHLKEKWIKCKICGQTFSSSSSLQNHKRVTHRTKEERRQFCTVEGCGKSFLDPAAFKTHVSNVHNNVNYPCNENGCGKVLSCKKSLSAHVTRVHKANLNLPCDQCNKKFKSLPNLRGHVRDVHEKMGFANCPKCNKSMRKSYIKKHLEIHKVKQDRKAFPCDQCTCVFYWKVLLRKHQRSEH